MHVRGFHAICNAVDMCAGGQLRLMSVTNSGTVPLTSLGATPVLNA